MHKEIHLEYSNKNAKFIGDYCLKDPKFLNINSLKKFKNKLITDYHWNDYYKMKKDYKFLDKFIKKKKVN